MDSAYDIEAGVALLKRALWCWKGSRVTEEGVGLLWTVLMILKRALHY